MVTEEVAINNIPNVDAYETKQWRINDVNLVDPTRLQQR